MFTSTPLPDGWPTAQPLRVSLTTAGQPHWCAPCPPRTLLLSPVHRGPPNTHSGHTHRSTSRQLWSCVWLSKHHVHCAASAAARCTRHGTPHTYSGDGACVTRNPRAVRGSLGGIDEDRARVWRRSVHSPAIVHDARWGCKMRVVGGRVVRCSRGVSLRRRNRSPRRPCAVRGRVAGGG